MRICLNCAGHPLFHSLFTILSFYFNFSFFFLPNLLKISFSITVAFPQNIVNICFLPLIGLHAKDVRINQAANSVNGRYVCKQYS